MEKLRSETPNWRTSQPIGLRMKTHQLESINTELIAHQITPKKALEEASFAFNIATDHTSVPLSPHVVRAGYIREFQTAAKTFSTIAEQSSGDIVMSFKPSDVESGDTRYDNYSLPLGEYAELLSVNANQQIAENFDSFSGAESVMTDPSRPPDYEKDSMALSALLFKEQWSVKELYSTPINELPPDNFPIDTNQIISLTEAQAALTTTADNNALSSQQKKEALETILETLNSRELDDSSLKDQPAALAMKLFANARTLHDLGVLSEDANPKDFDMDKQTYIKAAIMSLRNAEAAVDKTFGFARDIRTIRDKIRYYHDIFSGEIGAEQVKWSKVQLSELPSLVDSEFNPNNKKSSTVRSIGTTATRHN